MNLTYRVAIILLLIFTSSTAFAGWNAISLAPQVGPNSKIVAVSNGNLAGSVSFGNNKHASLWIGSSGSWIDLNPEGFLTSGLSAISGDTQVGVVALDYRSAGHASLWQGSASSWVDLHPSGYTSSTAKGVSGNQQVGSVFLQFVEHAALWYGSAGSFIDLNPSGADESGAYATNGTQQGGWASIAGHNHAGMWNGSASSWIDLNPAGSPESYICGMSADQQVGSVYYDRASEHACIWEGTADSWIDLAPNSMFWSSAIAVSNGVQVGSATKIIGNSTQSYAALWKSTPESIMDLSSLLQPGVYSSSTARGIEVIGDEIWVLMSFRLCRNEYAAVV